MGGPGAGTGAAVSTTKRRGNSEGSNPMQRADGRWQILIRHTDEDGVSRRYTVNGITAKDARDRAGAIKKRLLANLPARDRKVTLGEFAGEWIESTLEASDRKATTKAMYAAITRKHIVGAKIGAKPLDKLRPSHIDAWKVELQGRGLSASTIRTAYTILRALLDSAVRDRALAQNPVHAVRRPKVTAMEAAYLKPEQVRSLLTAAEGSRYAPLFALLVHTGLRRGEALALHWSDVDLDAKLLRVHGTLARVDGELIVTETKTPKSRRAVPLSPTAERLLRDIRTRQAAERLRAGSMWQRTPYIFTTELGEPCDPRNALRALKVAANRAGLPSTVGLHTLRHSAASVMLTAGVPLKVVSEVFGHASIAITGDVYGHVSPDVSREALDRLSEALQ
jgi:integrase